METWSELPGEGAAELAASFGREAEQLLNWLSGYGADPQGGVTRLLYSDSWAEAQLALAERMKRAGFAVSFDRAGNLFGRLEGEDCDAPAIMTGSHIDTVASGGRYDGAYGIIAALLAVEHLQRRFGKPRRSIEVIALAEEEGSRFPMTYWGSGSIAGLYHEGHIEGMRDSTGIEFRQAMKSAGFGKPEQKDCRRSDIALFVELHIEQGIVLERESTSIGIVEAIVGQKRFAIQITGEANHAGTTPMRMRKDALAAAAEMIRAVRQSATLHGAPLVATVGRLELEPNVPNVIPGKAAFTVDVRHDDENVLGDFCSRMISEFKEIADYNGVAMAHSLWMDVKPAPMHPALTDLTETICREHRLSYKRMVSGAGHDAQVFQRMCPTAMVFVPSRGGISHSPLEYTSPDDLGRGVYVLGRMLYQLGYAEAYKGGVV
ncbi:allantoate deiminase [Paenibacillus sp. NPDC056579]|uniref:allantoate deiminase n=1 Tax=Paenibacillus sp. NPDC056579 TaxID=3345871 RepID=UPI0036A2DB33